jgi:hypothetical protein
MERARLAEGSLLFAEGRARRVACGLTGWTLQDTDQHVYTFPTFTINAGAKFTIHTGQGSNKNLLLYLGLRPRPGAVGHGVVPRAAQVSDRFLLERRDSDRGELPGPVQPGESPGSRRSVLMRSPGANAARDRLVPFVPRGAIRFVPLRRHIGVKLVLSRRQRPTSLSATHTLDVERPIASAQQILDCLGEVDESLGGKPGHEPVERRREVRLVTVHHLERLAR